MYTFAQLYTALDETTKTNVKVEALTRYFECAEPADAAWALFFLTGRRVRQAVPLPTLRAWAVEAAGIPDWLFGECYDAVGDFAETVTLLLPEPGAWSVEVDRTVLPFEDPQPLHRWVEEVLIPLREQDETTQRAIVRAVWATLGGTERFVWNKLITGAFRVGVSQQLVVRALARVSGANPAAMAHRLMGEWQPSAAFYQALLAHDTADSDVSRPYPFCLAHPLDDPPELLGSINEWQAEWKWDGIRSQLIHRAGQTFLWSRGEELITDRFPEIAAIGAFLPDGVVIDGEVLPWKEGAVLPFAQLQRRIGRKNLTKAILDEAPAALLAYDLLELDGVDVRKKPLEWRRAKLERLIATCAPGNQALLISPVVVASDWDDLAAQWATSRARNVEGLMLKRRNSPYHVGRVRGDWWKWKVMPYTIDAVLIYAQRGSGKRASLYTDYTFAVWDGDRLTPFAKAYSGLTDEEIREVDAFVRRNTVEKFGPVRTVTPELVFELAFEGIQRSSRHKSGIAVRFPRILRWRRDKRPADADTLEQVRALLPEGS
jgi:DNA ligase-1